MDKTSWTDGIYKWTRLLGQTVYINGQDFTDIQYIYMGKTSWTDGKYKWTRLLGQTVNINGQDFLDRQYI